jgi:hypothetical protein
VGQEGQRREKKGGTSGGKTSTEKVEEEMDVGSGDDAAGAPTMTSILFKGLPGVEQKKNWHSGHTFTSAVSILCLQNNNCNVSQIISHFFFYWPLV